MDSRTLSGDYNDSLRGDAEQFGGEGESEAVPTHHVKITSGDLARFADTKETLIVDGVAFVWKPDPPTEPPEADFVAFVSGSTLAKLARGGIVNYGVRRIGGENQTLHVSKGGVSDLFEDDRTPKERIRQEQPHLAGYVR